MLHTTLNLLRKANACTSRYKVLCKALGGAKRYGYSSPISITFIVENNGLDDALWALRAVSNEKLGDKIARLFAVGCGYRVLPNFEKNFPNDYRIRMCLESSCLYAFGELTDQELSAAESAAWSAAESAARSAARSAAWSATEFAEQMWQKQFLLELLNPNHPIHKEV